MFSQKKKKKGVTGIKYLSYPIYANYLVISKQIV